MKTAASLRSFFALTVFALVLTFGPAVKGAENLGEIISDTGWDKLIGTWVDEKTKGEINRSTFSWRYQDTVLETITEQPGKETTSLFGLNPKTGKVFVVAADSAGASSSGDVEFKEGVVLFKVSYITETAIEGEVEIKYVLVDDDTIDLVFAMEEPVTMRLVREK